MSVQPGTDTAASGCLNTVEGFGLLTKPASGTAGDAWNDAISGETIGASDQVRNKMLHLSLATADETSIKKMQSYWF